MRRRPRAARGRRRRRRGRHARRVGRALRLDESILTGESRPVTRAVGEEVRSGSFAVEGAGAFVVDRGRAGQLRAADRRRGAPVPPSALAARALAEPAAPRARRRDGPARDDLHLRALAARRLAIHDAVTTAVAGIVTLVPEGLILLASLTFAAAALAARAARGARAAAERDRVARLGGRRSAWTRPGRSPQAGLRVVVVRAGERRRPGRAAPRARTLRGELACAQPDARGDRGRVRRARRRSPDEYVPFSSARRWSGAAARRRPRYVLGAPERFPLGPLADVASASRRRDAASSRSATRDGRARARTTARRRACSPLGLVVLAEAAARRTRARRSRSSAPRASSSASSPATRPRRWRRSPRDAGHRRRRAGAADGSRRAASAARRARVGRISPEGKQQLVERLRDEGRYVAMVGDGVNDVPALKAARLAIAQGSGSEMARSVADVVLVSGDFAAVPDDGRAGPQDPPQRPAGREALRDQVGVRRVPRARRRADDDAVSAPAAAPDRSPRRSRSGSPGSSSRSRRASGPWRTDGFLREVARFSLPAGTAAGLGVLSAYLFALNVIQQPLVEARTVALIDARRPRALLRARARGLDAAADVARSGCSAPASSSASWPCSRSSRRATFFELSLVRLLGRSSASSAARASRSPVSRSPDARFVPGAVPALDALASSLMPSARGRRSAQGRRVRRGQAPPRRRAADGSRASRPSSTTRCT